MGAIRCKLDLNKKVTRMGYITKLAADINYRERDTSLVKKAIEAMGERYSRLQDFFQKGHSRAMVEVTLKNEGEDAYKSEIYGANITFQRIMDDNGQNNVILKDHKQNAVK